MIFLVLGQSSVLNGARFEPTFRSVVIGIIVYVRLFCLSFVFIVCTRGSLEAVHRLVETRALSLVHPHTARDGTRPTSFIDLIGSFDCCNNKVAYRPGATDCRRGWFPR